MTPRAHWLYDTKNWGDIFTPFLFKEGFGVELEQAQPEEAELFSCGSLLERIPNGFTGHVLGSGCGHASTRCDLSQVKMPLLLRGRLTFNRANMQNHNARMGDPGILAYMFRSPTTKKTHKLGIIPHVRDRHRGDLAYWVERKDALHINIEAGISEVVDAAASCEQIVSSSLHGLVIADSLGIPNAWLRSQNLPGEGFKFYDYYSAYGEEAVPSSTIADAVTRLRDRFVECIREIEPHRRAVTESIQEYAESLK